MKINEKEPFEDGANPKQEQLGKFTTDNQGEFLTTDQGLKINDDQNSLKAGDRGATLLEDFILREKITHFDHERIPERIVHARGSGAHGVFELYKPMAKYTKAKFLNDTSIKTPVFVRFSTVAGSRGSTDMPRDIRGFAVKFYTQEGNYDLVGNNTPVFFIQDASKFPDLVHAVKPEPHNEIPQAASAHDTFWDFISLMPEAMHNIMWLMSDRSIPRSLRMMEGFGIHTFRFINEKGVSHFVKFHWKPLQGVLGLAWDEAQRIAGKDTDFHRRDLWEAIDEGHYPEWELGVQIVPEKDEHKYPFDLLDPTKIIPEEMVPVEIIGKMTLNRNPDNFFAETEQVAFHPGHLVPGIDFTNDPLLQGRLFSYTDTQISRLGGPNFHEIPINKSIPDVTNHQRDGMHRMQINKGKVSYNPNSIGGGCPFQAMMSEGGFNSYEERIDATKIRKRSKSFFDHFSQPELFYNSLNNHEKRHLQNAFSFELGKVKIVPIRQRMVNMLLEIDKELANIVADNLGLKTEKLSQPITGSIPADGKLEDYKSFKNKLPISSAPSLSMANKLPGDIKSRRVALLTADGVNDEAFTKIKKELSDLDAMVSVIAPNHGFVTTKSGDQYPIDESLLTATSVVFDAVYVAGGNNVKALSNQSAALHFIAEAFKHCKPIGADKDAVDLIKKAIPEIKLPADGVCTNEKIMDFVKDIKQHRFWERELNPVVPA
ncbi:MAG: catalase [Bacteroidetes bacterium]|nr:catalase [Bacteroidota bacterium]MBP7399813.1 catalase [Chitinophagales bacterium]MBK8486346.1 catalase [Bacteroidota bacterium]MBK8683128.1 catalase [Bacteroidota bacterium]MBP8754070.1 catalase [Chitinophagales bacterium]